MWYSNDMFHYTFKKAEIVTLVSLNVPSGSIQFQRPDEVEPWVRPQLCLCPKISRISAGKKRVVDPQVFFCHSSSCPSEK